MNCPKRIFTKPIATALLTAGMLAVCGCDSKTAAPGTGNNPKSQAQGTGTPAASPAKDPEFKTTAEALVKEALAGSTAFNAKYAGKVVEAEGKVQSSGVISTEYGFMLTGVKNKPDDVITTNLVCSVIADQKAKGFTLAKGQKVKVIGRVANGSTLAVYLEQCSFTELEPNPIPKITAEALTKEFAMDSEAANKKYGLDKTAWKELLISGTVADLTSNKNQYGVRHSIILAGADGMIVDVDCAVHKKATDGLKKGDKVTIKGEILFYDENKKSISIGFSNVVKD